MNRCSLLFLVAALAVAATVQAQDANPLVTEAKRANTGTFNNLIAAAEKMPEADYSFKPMPEEQSFGEMVAHYAGASIRSCSGFNGSMRQMAEAKSKAELVAALKDAQMECDKAYDSLTDAKAAEMLPGGRGNRTRLGALYGNEIHNEHGYAQMAVYLRLKGMVPPSTESRGAMGGGMRGGMRGGMGKQ